MEPAAIADDLRACPHFPSIPDSKMDQAQAKALLRTLGCQEGKRRFGGG